MARISYSDKNDTGAKYNAICKYSYEMKETNDCAVKAVALLTGADYEHVHKIMASFGRISHKGTSTLIIDRTLYALGFEVTHHYSGSKCYRDIIASYPGAHKDLSYITLHHPKRFSKVWREAENCLLYVNAHVSALVDGKLEDWAVGRAKRVYMICTIKKVK